MRASRELFGPGFLDTDGPLHRTLRNAVRPAIGPLSVKSASAHTIEPIVDDILGAIDDSEDIDFIARVATAVPYRVLSRLLGLPDTDTSLLFELMRPIARAIDYPRGSSRDAEAALQALAEYLADAGKTTTSALASRLADALRGEINAGASVHGSLVFLLFAGTETSISAIANIMHCLLTHPRYLDQFWNGELSVPGLVAETLRWEPPTHSVLRFAAEPTIVRGVWIPRRSPVLLSLASASRDEDLTEDAHRWDPNRQERTIIGLRLGAPRMPGMALAQRELADLFTALRSHFQAVDCHELPPIAGHAFRRSAQLRSAPPPRRTHQRVVMTQATSHAMDQLVAWLLERHPSCQPILLDTDLVDDVLEDSLEFIAFLIEIEEVRSPIPENQVAKESFRTLRAIRDASFPPLTRDRSPRLPTPTDIRRLHADINHLGATVHALGTCCQPRNAACTRMVIFGGAPR